MDLTFPLTTYLQGQTLQYLLHRYASHRIAG